MTSRLRESFGRASTGLVRFGQGILVRTKFRVGHGILARLGFGLRAPMRLLAGDAVFSLLTTAPPRGGREVGSTDFDRVPRA